jgi:hypothetical protein
VLKPGERYWIHRIEHELNFFWNNHVVHHIYHMGQIFWKFPGGAPGCKTDLWVNTAGGDVEPNKNKFPALLVINIGRVADEKSEG